MSLELWDIQGNVLRGYGLPFGCHLFVRIEDGASARAWLAGAAGRVTSAEVQAQGELEATCNIAFSAAGLGRLDVPASLVAEFSDEFRAGMAQRAAQLGDTAAAHPDRWPENAFRSGSAHLAVSIHGQTKERLKTEVGRLRRELDDANLKVLHDRRVKRLPGDREHFGFADGFGQPHVAGAPSGRRPAAGPTSDVTQPLPAGEFLLGYRDLDAALPPGPPGPLGRNGTYMVYREFDQDVAGFRRFLRRAAEEHGVSEELLAAKIVGRWRDGTPLAVSPDRPGADADGGPAAAHLDDFGYADDRSGLRCPLGAHIRRANPRETGPGLESSRRHRMIRRGMTYGPPLADGVLDDDGRERGLAFVCFVADVHRQFELVLGQWCNDGNAFGLGAEADLVVGSGEGAQRMTIPGERPIFLERRSDGPDGAGPFVTTRGGEYFYLPGITGLAALARGTTYG